MLFLHGPHPVSYTHLSHGDAVTEIPADFVRIGTSADCPYAAIENPDKHIYGIQFHPEVRHSVYGNDILRNFALNICKAKGDWSMDLSLIHI